MTYTVAVVTAGLTLPSTTRLLADRLTTAVTDRLKEAGEDVLVEVVELRPLAHALADNLVTGFPSEELEAAISTVSNADALVAVTPVFTASYSGLFKTFFDVLDKDALVGMPTLVGATAGTARHSLVLEHALRPLFAYLRAVVVPTAVYAATEDFGSAAPSGEGDALADRIGRAADELVALLARGRAVRRRTVRPADRFDDPLDHPFDHVVPFEQLLNRGA
jgi:FMN reductase